MSCRHLTIRLPYRAHLGPMGLHVPGYELADVLRTSNSPYITHNQSIKPQLNRIGGLLTVAVIAWITLR